MKNFIKWFALLTFLQALLLSCISSEKSPITHLPFKLTEEGNWGLISSDGTIVVSGEYSNPPYVATEGIYIVQNKSGKFEYFRAETIPTKVGTQYIKASAFSESLAPVIENEEIISVINSKGEIVFNIEDIDGKKITSCSSFSEGFAIIENEEGLKGYIDKTGRIIVKPKYSEANNFSEGVAIIRSDFDKKSYWQIIDKKGEIILELDSDIKATLGIVSSNLLGYSKSEQLDSWGFLNLEGEQVIHSSRDYVNVSPLFGNLFIYNNGLKFGVADVDGKRIIPAEYDQIEYSDNGYFIVKKGDIWFIIDNDNRETTNIDFTNHTSNINGNIFVKVRDKYILINSKGDRIGNTEIADVALNMPPLIVSIDLQNFNKTILDLFQNIGPGKLWHFSIGSSASEAANLLGAGSAEFLKSTRSLTTKRVATNIESIITVGFSEEMAVAITEREMLRDMWGRAYWDNVVKGYSFNSNSHLQDISANIKLMSDLKGKENEIVKALVEIARVSGFSIDNEKSGSIKLSTGMGRTLNINYAQNTGVNLIFR